MKEYPIQFYGRTLDAWGVVLIIGPLVAAACIAGALLNWGFVEIPDNHDGSRDIGFLLLIVGTVIMTVPLVFMYRLYALQRPILKIFREGLEIRTVGTTLPDIQAWDITHYLTMFILIGQFVTLQMFRTRTVRLRWENIHEMFEGKGVFSLAGRTDRPFRVSYGCYSFGMPTDEVNEAVQFFLWNADFRETLPSWHDEEADEKRAEEEERRNLRIER